MREAPLADRMRPSSSRLGIKNGATRRKTCGNASNNARLRPKLELPVSFVNRYPLTTQGKHKFIMQFWLKLKGLPAMYLVVKASEGANCPILQLNGTDITKLDKLGIPKTRCC